MGGASTQNAPGFQSWKSQYAPNDTGADYDLYGAYKAGLKPDADRGHFPDTFKMTNHPTFSVESKYSTPEHPGGVWGTTNGRDTFTPSAWMASDAKRMENLKKYFAKAEPNAILVLPTSTTVKPMGGSNTQTTSAMPTTPAIYDTERNLVSLDPRQVALYNASQRQVQGQDAALAEAQSRYLKQYEGQQNEAYATAFANRDAKFSLPQTQPKFDSPNLYGREANAPDTQK